MTTTTVTTVETITEPAKEQVGLLVTKELEKAIEDCKARVQRIAKDCRAKNRKFRQVFLVHGYAYPHYVMTETLNSTWRTIRTDVYTV